jgi:D-3-phosphoglycerate dehydrogenase
MKAFITANITEDCLKELKKEFEVTYENWTDTGIVYFDVNELIEKLEGYDVFITEADDLKKREIFEQTDLKLVVSCRGDPFNVDLKSATENKVPVVNTPLRNVDAVAELTVGLMLALARKIHNIDRVEHSEEFEILDFEDYLKYYEQFRGIELKEKTVGIIGLGQIGERVAKRLEPFGVKFLIYDPYIKTQKAEKYGRKVDIDYLVRNSDIITIHAVASDENDNLINEERIDVMKKSAFLLNLAKGSLVDYRALFKALEEKRIAGAALDVFPMEPIDEDNEFLELDNAIVTPHIGGSTYEVIERQSDMLLNDIKKWLNDEIPDHILNPEVFGKKKRSKKKGKSIQELKQEIVDVCQKLLEEGHVIGSAGNVSIRVPKEDGEDIVLITPSGVNYTEMEADDVLLIDMDGKVLEGERNPSVEKHLHLGVYKKREDVNAIIHAHSVYSSIIGTLKLSLPPVIEELVPYLGGEIKCAEYGEAGSEELAKSVEDNLEEKNALFLANHGNLCCGTHLDGAYTVLTYLERGAKIYYLSKLAGTPNLLPEDTIEYEEEIFEIFKESKKI